MNLSHLFVLFVFLTGYEQSFEGIRLLYIFQHLLPPVFSFANFCLIDVIPAFVCVKTSIERPVVECNAFTERAMVCVFPYPAGATKTFGPVERKLLNSVSVKVFRFEAKRECSQSGDIGETVYSFACSI